jgi:hypothetical protein
MRVFQPQPFCRYFKKVVCKFRSFAHNGTIVVSSGETSGFAALLDRAAHRATLTVFRELARTILVLGDSICALFWF